MTWGAEARCAESDPEAWFPTPASTHRDMAMAKAICRSCPERQPCLEYAMKNRTEGIWGGTTEHDREAIRRANGEPPRNANAAKTECIHGHKFTVENTYVNAKGSRACRTCERIRRRKGEAA